MKKTYFVRKLIVLTLVHMLFVFLDISFVCSQSISEDADVTEKQPLNAEQIRKMRLPSVVFIKSGDHSGSGVVVKARGPSASGEYKLILTNAHVTEGEDNVRVYFPAYDTDGTEIRDREFYLTEKNRIILERLGYVTEGRVIAENKETDVAIIRPHGFPKTVKMMLGEGINYPQKVPGEAVHILGHPGNRNLLWQWDPGHFQKSDGVTLTLAARAWFGNSGGPVVNQYETL